MPYPNPEGITYYYFVPTSYVASVETSINTTRNRYEMCTHPTGGNPQYVPKPRIWYHTVVVLCQFFWFWREIVFDVTYVPRVYNTVVWLFHFFCCGGKVLLRPEKKKFYCSRLSGGLCCQLCQFLALAGNRFWLYILLCIYVRGLAKIFWPNTSGYIVGKYIISD